MADLNQLRRGGSCAVDAVDSVTPTVEHEVLSRCRPLKGNGIIEYPDHVRRDAANRMEHIDAQRGARTRRDEQQEREKSTAKQNARHETKKLGVRSQEIECT